MFHSGRIVMSAGVLTVGCLFGIVRADGPDTTEELRQAQVHEAVLAEAIDDERHFLHRRAMLQRLRGFALEANDRDRLEQLDRLAEVHERRHAQRSLASLSRMNHEMREKLQAMRHERRERMKHAKTKENQTAHDRRDLMDRFGL